MLVNSFDKNRKLFKLLNASTQIVLFFIIGSTKISTNQAQNCPIFERFGAEALKSYLVLNALLAQQILLESSVSLCDFACLKNLGAIVWKVKKKNLKKQHFVFHAQKETIKMINKFSQFLKQKNISKELMSLMIDNFLNQGKNPSQIMFKLFQILF